MKDKHGRELRPWEVEEQVKRQGRLNNPKEVVVENGIKYWRVKWEAKEGPIPYWVYEDAGLECPEVQRVAYEKWSDEWTARYRKEQANRKPSAEELFEMEAAFGPGETVVNVLTGRVTKLPGKKRK